MSLLVVKAYEFVSGSSSLTGTVISAISGYLEDPNAESSSGLSRRGFGSEPGAASLSGLPLEPEGAPNGRFLVALATGFIALLVFALIEYTFKVILVVGIVESPPAIYLPIESDDPDGRNRKPTAVLGVAGESETYVTSSIRGTIKHLRAQAGALALWRGLSATIAYTITLAVVRAIFTGVLRSFLPMAIVRPVAMVLSFLALTRFSMVCTHIIISQAQPKTWIFRLFSVPWSTARKTLPVRAYFALITAIGAEVYYYGTTLNIHLATKCVILAIGLMVSVFITFPAMVALVRVQASFLPDSQEGIVAFDRSFGKLDGTALSFKEALKSLGCAGWRRIYKLAAKIVLITTALSVIFGAIVGLEMIWVMAGAPKKELGNSISFTVTA